MRMFGRTSAAAALAAAAALTLLVPTGSQAAGTDALPYSGSTGVGVHNAYDKAKYPYFADALDSGAALLELDVWTNGLGGTKFRVAHDNPFGNNNNCENAANASQLRVKPVNQGFDGCLADIKAWSDAHPGHAPVQLKVEMKDGFNDKGGLGPDEFDALVGAKLGSALYRPADLVGGRGTLDAAALAGAWPTRAALAGKFLVELIPGTVEESNPFDSLWTDKEYATRLRSLAAAGTLAQAAAFPAVHGAAAGDPRTSRYPDATLRPWFVFFDGDAAAYVDGGIDTAWYDSRHYIVVMTDVNKVAPAIDGTHPTAAEASAKAAQVAARHGSLVTADWYALPSVLSSVYPRG